MFRRSPYIQGWQSNVNKNYKRRRNTQILLYYRELMKLKLPKRPDFRINKFQLNLYMLHIKLDLNLGNLHVNGQYEVNNENLQQLLPVTYNGIIM